MELKSSLNLNGKSIYCLLSLEEEIMAIGDQGNKIIIFNVLKNTKEEAKIREMTWHSNWVYALEKVGRDCLLSGDNNGLLVLSNWRTATKLKEIKFDTRVGYKSIKTIG